MLFLFLISLFVFECLKLLFRLLLLSSLLLSSSLLLLRLFNGDGALNSGDLLTNLRNDSSLLGDRFTLKYSGDLFIYIYI